MEPHVEDLPHGNKAIFVEEEVDISPGPGTRPVPGEKKIQWMFENTTHFWSRFKGNLSGERFSLTPA